MGMGFEDPAYIYYYCKILRFTIGYSDGRLIFQVVYLCSTLSIDRIIIKEHQLLLAMKLFLIKPTNLGLGLLDAMGPIQALKPLGVVSDVDVKCSVIIVLTTARSMLHPICDV